MEGEAVNIGCYSNGQKHLYILLSWWVCIFRDPGKNFLHDELSSLRFEGFEDVSGGGSTTVCVWTHY